MKENQKIKSVYRGYGKLMKYGVIIAAMWSLTAICHASDFASSIISVEGMLGPWPYNDPYAVLGEPTKYMIGDLGKRFACSVVYGAWNRTFQSNEYGTDKVIATLEPGSSIIVGFDHQIADDINNPFGIDFIVFGNTAFGKPGTSYIFCNTNMDQLALSDPAYTFDEESVIVSVAQDPNGPWYTFKDGPFADADLFPTNSFAWDGLHIGADGCADWGQAANPLKPVDPTLQWADFDGLTAAQAITLYNGSAGGTGFDLQWLETSDYEELKPDPRTGRRWIQYIKLRSDFYGEVDAISDVAACGDYQHPFPAGDVNEDCRVNLMDLMVLAENWMVCTWMCQ